MKTLALMLLLAMASPALASSNLVTNGSFSTGDFTGWREFGDTSANFVADRGYTGFYDFRSDGANAELTSFGEEAGIYQDLATVAGQSYRLSFRLGGAWGEYFSVGFGDGEVMRFGDVWQGLQAYTTIVTAGGDTSRLRFAAHNDNDYYVLDTVAVTMVPEPQVWALMVTGFVAAGVMQRRRRAVAA